MEWLSLQAIPSYPIQSYPMSNGLTECNIDELVQIGAASVLILIATDPIRTVEDDGV